MRRKSKASLLLSGIALLLASIGSLAGSSAEEWAKQTSAVIGNAESIGKYNAGCLRGAATLPLEGQGYQVMRLSRHRYYGHPKLIDFIRHLGETVSSQNFGTLLIGDLGQPRGGPTLSGHRSHQTGLDVDIWFLLSEQANQRLLTENERETMNATSMVNLRTDTVDTQNWTASHQRILQVAAQQSEVERIFVNPSIKQALCLQKTANSAAWLSKIRPWWKHDDHFHVRLKCPENSPHCESQEPLPSGDGCDASLAWWFSEEAKSPAKAQPPAPPLPLPALCEQVLRE